MRTVAKEITKEEALSVFTDAVRINSGHPTVLDVANFIKAGFTINQAVDIIATISAKTMRSYSNHITTLRFIQYLKLEVE